MAQVFDSREVVRILYGFNPWWAGRAPSVPKFRRLAFTRGRGLLSDEEFRRAVLLCGPRRVGKTTILQQMVEALLEEGRPARSVLYLSLDHPFLRLVSLPDILQLYHENIYPEGQPAVLLLDEVHYSRDWELHIKHIVDHQPVYRIVATGSASVTQRHLLAESGVGRWMEVPVPTLSFFEFIRIRGADPPRVPATLRPSDLFNQSPEQLTDLGLQCRQLMPAFRDYLLLGGFPETARRQDISFCQRLLREDVIDRVLKRDMAELFRVRNVGDLERLFIYLCLHSGGMFSVQACGSALGSAATTVARYLEALIQANLIYRLAPAGLTGKKVLKARYKYYLVDAALRNAVLLRGEEILSDPDEMGTIVETTVLRHLYAFHYRDTPEIVYWRDSRTKKEVDIIIKSPQYVIPVEVKYRGNPSCAANDGLALYCRAERVGRAYWITQRDEDFGVVRFSGVDTQFLKIPAHIFCYLIGQAEQQS